MLTRRAFVGGVVAAVVLGGRPAAAQAGVGRVLARRRATTFRQLVLTARGCPDRRWRRASPDGAARAFGRWYAAQPTEGRVHADRVLDLVLDGGGVTTLMRADSTDAAATRAAALALVCEVCEPPPDADEHPVVPAMVAR